MPLDRIESAALFLQKGDQKAPQQGELRDLTLTEANLENVLIEGSTISGDFESSSFLGAAFRKSSILDSSFKDANFANSVFGGASLKGSSFDNVTFQSCVFENTSFEKCSLMNALFLDCSFKGLVSFLETRLDSAIILGGKGDALSFSKATLDQFILRESEFKSILVEGGTASGVQLPLNKISLFSAKDVDLTSANFMKSVLDKLMLEGLKLEGAIFIDCEVNSGIFKGSLASKAVFTGATLKNCDFSGVKAQMADFSHADLGGSLLKGADFSLANFHRTKGVDLGSSGALYQGARMTDPELATAEDFMPKLVTRR
jgi:uncharacterized protein YjbI with pentapeptide repeats